MFKAEQVTKVYSGRKGCACGCKGKYTYAKASDRPDYMTGDDGVNPQTVKMMVGKVERMMADQNSAVESVMVDPDGDWFAVDMENDRTYTVYFAEGK